jgi:uncharacterized protein (TIGR02646 family)
MLPINKLPEPQSLRNYKLRRGNSASYSGFKGGKFLELREQLLKEQKYVCAYCGQKLLVVFVELNGKENQKMKTEHFVPQNGNVDNDLNYQNLLGCSRRLGRALLLLALIGSNSF